jgi:hypothetical protein
MMACLDPSGSDATAWHSLGPSLVRLVVDWMRPVWSSRTRVTRWIARVVHESTAALGENRGRKGQALLVRGMTVTDRGQGSAIRSDPRSDAGLEVYQPLLPGSGHAYDSSQCDYRRGALLSHTRERSRLSGSCSMVRRVYRATSTRRARRPGRNLARCAVPDEGLRTDDRPAHRHLVLVPVLRAAYLYTNS